MNYGKCECGRPLIPIWYKEKERDSNGIVTDRERIACSYLLCESCGRNYTVDDSFDSEWRYVNEQQKGQFRGSHETL